MTWPASWVIYSKTPPVWTRCATTLRRAVQLARKVPRHLSDHGLVATARKVRARLIPKISRLAPRPTREEPRIIVLSHMLDLSGAPYVLMDLVKHMVYAGLREHLQF